MSVKHENQVKDVTESGMINVVYITWFTVITAGQTFLPCARN